jgi:hypothetical protein
MPVPRLEELPLDLAAHALQRVAQQLHRHLRLARLL